MYILHIRLCVFLKLDRPDPFSCWLFIGRSTGNALVFAILFWGYLCICQGKSPHLWTKPYNIVGYCWLLLVIVGYCWLLLVIVGYFWLLLVIVGYIIFINIIFSQVLGPRVNQRSAAVFP